MHTLLRVAWESINDTTLVDRFQNTMTWRRSLKPQLNRDIAELLAQADAEDETDVDYETDLPHELVKTVVQLVRNTPRVAYFLVRTVRWLQRSDDVPILCYHRIRLNSSIAGIRLPVEILRQNYD